MAVVIAVLVTFINRILYNDPELRSRMTRQVYLGAAAGLVVCLAIAAAFIIAFQVFRVDVWGSDHFEQLWQGIFKLVATLMITFMCFTMIKAEYWQLKWEQKLRAAAREAVNSAAGAAGLDGARQRWAMFILPFTVVIREGLEALVLLGGTSASASAKSIILPAITGTLTGVAIGWLVWRGGRSMVLTRYIQISTGFLLLVAAGLFASCEHEFEELADTETVWVEFGDDWDKEEGNVFAQFLGLMGWTNKWTMGTTLSYIGYWVVVLPLMYVYWRRQSVAADRMKAEAETDRQLTESELGEGTAVGAGISGDVPADDTKGKYSPVE
ncbi:iron permease FTR1 family-domain-containing protein [Blastocladiella britannica]|nr:iron permease FTR1 family-domain-containing protein [Blastocladiella britannica]